MRIALIEVENYRGIRQLRWAPSPGVNCLIGPGDSTKTTVLDAIELCLNPKPNHLADDCDFFDLDVGNRLRITVTLVDLPEEFKAIDRYGLYLRGWNVATATVEDEPAVGLLSALSIRVEVDESLEAHWSIFNERLNANDEDPRMVRYKDAQLFATTRVGPYADRHLRWGRASLLARLNDESAFNLDLAKASRAARESFRAASETCFRKTAERAEELSRAFAVPVRKGFAAELDVQGVSISTGGIALHDGGLPLRTLGSGSSRLIVASLQAEARPCRVALMDEVEHGLEPHRLARLLRYLKQPRRDGAAPQLFLTTHSPVAIRELPANEVFAVRSSDGVTEVRPLVCVGMEPGLAQGHARRAPEAYLARKIIVGEGRTEEGLVRGLDAHWTSVGRPSLALQGVVAVGGGGKDDAPRLAEHLLELGYKVLLLMDSDKAPDDPNALAKVTAKGGVVAQWPDSCSTELRVFLDVEWKAIQTLLGLAAESRGEESVKDGLNHRLTTSGLQPVPNLTLTDVADSEQFRRAVAAAALAGKWFKTVTEAEAAAAVVGPELRATSRKPLVKVLAVLRNWIDE